MIRRATRQDIADVLRLGREFHEASRFADFAAFGPGSFQAAAENLIDAGSLLVLDRGGVVGMAAFVVFPAYFNASVLIAQELFWFVEPEHRDGSGSELLDAMERAAKEAGASALMMGCLQERSDALARVYRRRGYLPLEHTFVRRL